MFFVNSCRKDECAYVNNCTTVVTENISTGLDAKGSAGVPGTSSTSWVMSAAPAPLVSGSVPLTLNPNPAWEPSPVAITNAGWINGVGTMFGGGSPVGNYTFERPINISAGTVSFSYNFKIAYDDTLVSLKLVRPDATFINLTATPATSYHLSAPVIGTIANPMSGTWKVVAVINLVDSVGGFITSGNVEKRIPCK